MKKKITALLLALLFVGPLASCGGSGNTIEDSSAVGADATVELETDASETEVENTTANSNGDEVSFDEDTALAYFETSEGQEWLYQYLFGAEEPADDTSGETTDSAEVSSEGFDALSTDEQATQIQEYLKTVDWLTTIDRTTVVIAEETTLDSFDFDGTFSEETDAEIVEDLKTRKYFDDAAWVALYENGFDSGQKTLFLAWYTENNTDPGPGGTEGSAVSADESAGSSTEDGGNGDNTGDDSDKVNAEDEKAPATGYDAWLSAKLQEEENADDRSKVWNDLTSPKLLQEYLATEDGQAFLGSDAVQQLLADYYTENEDAMEDLAVSTGYRAKMVKKSFITLAIVVVVLLAVFAGALLLLLSRADKQKKKLRRELKAAEDQLNAVPTRPAGGMDLALKQKLTASPVRETPAAPVTPVAPPTPPVVKTPSKPIEPEKPVTQPVVPAAPVITGYYSLPEEAVEAARYHLTSKFSVRKVSEKPLNSPTPYVGYSDHTLDLNRDYYAKAGGNKTNNARAWDSLMGSTVQITECFSIVTQDGIPVTDVSSATGKQIVSVERAKIGADGSITARGTITLA